MEGAWNAFEEARENFGGNAACCAALIVLSIVFSILDKEDPSWSVIMIPTAIYAILTIVKAIAQRIYSDE